MGYKYYIKNTIQSNKNIIVNIVGAFLVKGGAMALSIVLLPAYIKFFGNKNILGLWYTVLSIINWVLVFDLGIGNGLRNKLPKVLGEGNYLEAKKLVSSTYIFALLLVGIFGILGTIIIQSLNWNVLLNIEESELSLSAIRLTVQIVYVGIMVQFVLKIITSILYAIQKSCVVNFLTLISSFIIFIIISFYTPCNLESAMISISYVNVVAINLPLVLVSAFLFCGKLKYIRPSFFYWSIDSSKSVLKTGVVLLWLQVVFMVISSTNEFLISFFCSPIDVFVFQIYFKVFNGVTAICALVLVPIWSAVTKAKIEGRFDWIMRTYKILLIFCFLSLVFEGIVVLFLQQIFNWWLDVYSVEVDYTYAAVVALYSFVFLVHSVNTSVGNGMSFFKPQLIFVTIAALVDVPLAWGLVNMTGGWIGVVLANIIVLLPYEISEPILFSRYINRLGINK